MFTATKTGGSTGSTSYALTVGIPIGGGGRLRLFANERSCLQKAQCATGGSVRLPLMGGGLIRGNKNCGSFPQAQCTLRRRRREADATHL